MSREEGRIEKYAWSSIVVANVVYKMCNLQLNI
jgi:hypothetical protein